MVAPRVGAVNYKTLALPLHAFRTPPANPVRTEDRNVRTGLGAAVRGGEPASLRAGE